MKLHQEMHEVGTSRWDRLDTPVAKSVIWRAVVNEPDGR